VREYLKRFRTEMHLTQREVANELNISESGYNLIEKGERQKDLNLSFVQKLSDIFGVSVSQIIEEEAKLRERVL